MTKTEMLKKALEERIAEYSAGDKLPGEIELSEEYSVSRMTVNKVITKLAEDGLVYRRKKAGTFVSGCRQSEDPIYVLIPYPGFLEEATLIGSTYWRLMNCLHTVTFGKVMPVVLVAVSQTNDENDIDEKNLEVIKPGGTVVCMGIWYRRTFPWLIERQCNVIYVNNQIAEDVMDYADKFHYITLDARQAAADTVKHLKNSGRCNPAFLSMLYHNKSTKMLHPFIDGWNRGINLLYPDLDSQETQIQYYPEEETEQQIAEKIENYLDNHECDALFISAVSMIQTCLQVLKNKGLKVPEDIALITNHGEDKAVDYPVAYFDFSIFQIAGEILNIYHQAKRQNKFISAKFHCLEYLEKDPVEVRQKPAQPEKPRNFKLEMTHI